MTFPQNFQERSTSLYTEEKFPHRIINFWNYLPEQVIKAEDVQIFEGRLDKFMNNQDILYDFKACFRFIT